MVKPAKQFISGFFPTSLSPSIAEPCVYKKMEQSPLPPPFFTFFCSTPPNNKNQHPKKPNQTFLDLISPQNLYLQRKKTKVVFFSSLHPCPHQYREIKTGLNDDALHRGLCWALVCWSLSIILRPRAAWLKCSLINVGSGDIHVSS